jgi:hypothetical protein
LSDEHLHSHGQHHPHDKQYLDDHYYQTHPCQCLPQIYHHHNPLLHNRVIKFLLHLWLQMRARHIASPPLAIFIWLYCFPLMYYHIIPKCLQKSVWSIRICNNFCPWFGPWTRAVISTMSFTLNANQSIMQIFTRLAPIHMGSCCDLMP